MNFANNTLQQLVLQYNHLCLMEYTYFVVFAVNDHTSFCSIFWHYPQGWTPQWLANSQIHKLYLCKFDSGHEGKRRHCMQEKLVKF